MYISLILVIICSGIIRCVFIYLDRHIHVATLNQTQSYNVYVVIQ